LGKKETWAPDGKSRRKNDHISLHLGGRRCSRSLPREKEKKRARLSAPPIGGGGGEKGIEVVRRTCSENHRGKRIDVSIVRTAEKEKGAAGSLCAHRDEKKRRGGKEIDGRKEKTVTREVNRLWRHKKKKKKKECRCPRFFADREKIGHHPSLQGRKTCVG